MRATIASRLLSFWQHYRALPPATRGALSVRDLLSWVGFINVAAPGIGAYAAYVHGAYLTLLDGLGLGVGAPAGAAAAAKREFHELLLQQLPDTDRWGCDAGQLSLESAEQAHAALMLLHSPQSPVNDSTFSVWAQQPAACCTT